MCKQELESLHAGADLRSMKGPIILWCLDYPQRSTNVVAHCCVRIQDVFTVKVLRWIVSKSDESPAIAIQPEQTVQVTVSGSVGMDDETLILINGINQVATKYPI